MAALPQCHLIAERAAADPAVLAAEYGEIIGIRIAKIRNMPRHRAISRAMAIETEPMRGFHQAL